MNDRIIEFVLLGVTFAIFTPVPLAAQDQTETQLWGNLALERIQNKQLTLGVAIEPKVLVSKPQDDPGWASLGVIPSIEYTRVNWVDATGELGVTRTKQADHVNSTEIRFASKQRFRVGVGSRRSYAWRFEALYVWDRSRHASSDSFVKGDQAVDLRLRRQW